MYPSMLLIFVTPTHLAAELVGSTPEMPREIKVLKRQLPGLANYFGHFPAPTGGALIGFEASGGGNGLSRLALVCERDSGIFKSKYPELPELHESILIFSGHIAENDAFHAFELPMDYRDLWLDDVMTVSAWRGQVRARYFQASWLIERSASSSELQRRLNERHPVNGPETRLLAPSGDETRGLIVKAANFSSLASVDKVGETTITKFLELNSDVLLRALGGERLIPQPLLPWIAGNPDPSETSIQPDFLVVDPEGAVHICEVKLPLLRRTTLTTGEHRRRRFVSAVAEGVAQLGNYLEYFSIATHKSLIEAEYGVTVSDPRLILIVGSSENYVEQEVIEAQRMLKTFELLDYDTVRALFLARSGYTPGRLNRV